MSDLGSLSFFNDIAITLSAIFFDKAFLGFVAGVMFALLLVLFEISKNPTCIPSMLCLPAKTCYRRFIKKKHMATKLSAAAHFEEFITLQKQVRALSIEIVFLAVLLTMLILFKK